MAYNISGHDVNTSLREVFGFELLASSLLSLQAGQDFTTGLIEALWSSGITAYDLRLIKRSLHQEVKVYILCRIEHTSVSSGANLHTYSLAAAARVEQIFKKYGYTLQLLAPGTLENVKQPFRYQVGGEIRRHEDVWLFSGDFYGRAEFYVPYPWEWYCSGPIPYFNALRQLSGDWLVSIYLEPTRLGHGEEALLDRAISPNVEEMLVNSARGREIYQIYTTLSQRLRGRPYLLRTILATTDQQKMNQMNQVFLYQEQQFMHAPVAQPAIHPYEQQATTYNLAYLAWKPWGSIRDSVPDSARLRYLTDSKGAQMLFHLPSSQIEKLKVLIVFANPSHTSFVHLQREQRLIEEAIRSSRYRDNIEKPVILPAATINDLSRALLEDTFHIVHISGHGDAQGLLLLENELGLPSPVPQAALANLFKRYKEHLRCVLLNICRGLSQGERIALNIPYTIAMEGALDDDAALMFSRGFYEAVGAGHEIEMAYDEGCSRVSLTTHATGFVSHLFRADGTSVKQKFVSG